jgi:hypothetical protein
MSYLTTKRDKSHLSIMHELQARGFSVADMAGVGSGFTDLIAADVGFNVLIEIKEPDGYFYISQLEFISTWKGYIGFAKSFDEALAIMRSPDVWCLTWQQKQKIAGIAYRYRAKSKDKNARISVSRFDKLMGEK